jgi:hypothetical protein
VSACPNCCPCCEKADTFERERDRLAERLDDALKAGEEHCLERQRALAQVAMLRDWMRDLEEFGDDYLSPSFLRRLHDLLDATADSGKWLEQHDDAVRAEEREKCARAADYYAKNSVTADTIAAAIRARGKK